MEQVQPSIENMNEVICEFMGGHRLINGIIHVYKGPDEIEWETGRYLKYHTSWDWLHDVWVKFRNLKFTEETSMKLHLNYVARLSQNMAYDTITEFHYRLYIAITWYNQQKQSI